MREVPGRLPKPPRFENNRILNADELNALVEYGRTLFEICLDSVQPYHSGRWGLFIDSSDLAGSRNSITDEDINELSIVLDSGRIVRYVGPVQASIPPDIGNYGIAEAENDPTDFGWSTSASPVVGRATKEVAWVAPVLHLGAEPQLWEYAVEIVAKVSELTSAVTSASGGLEAVAVAVWRVLLSRTERCLSDPWADPRDTLGNVDDLVVFGHELLSAERTSLPAVLRRNPGCDELLDQFRRRSIWLDELLDAWKRLNRPPGPFRFKPVIQAGDMELHLFEMADGGSRVRLRVREVNSRSARYGFSDLSEPDISVTDKKLSNNADVELEPSGRFLHVRLHKSAVVDVEGIGE